MPLNGIAFHPVRSIDPERVHTLDRSAEECERIAGSKRRRQERREPGGFTSWDDLTRRNYEKSVLALAPNIDVAAEQREREAVYVNQCCTTVLLYLN